MAISSRSPIDLAGFELLAVRVHPSPCEVRIDHGSGAHCCAPGVMVLRYMYRTGRGKIVTAHEVQCAKHLEEWKKAHSTQLTLCPA